MGELADFCRTPRGAVVVMVVIALGISALHDQSLYKHQWARVAIFVFVNAILVSWGVLVHYIGD